MADKKITQLPASTVPLAGTEVLPIVQGTTPTTKQVSVANLTAGRSISATQYTSTIATGTPPLVVASTTEVANLKAATATLADSATSATSANAIKSNATTGLLQVTGPAAASTRVMTTPDANFTVARTDAAQSFTDNQTLSTGNLVIGTSGKGIDFSATASGSGTMTSELLADYEEGTWTPVITFNNGSVGQTYATTYTGATYTKIGNRVFVSGYINLTNKGSSAGVARIAGLPFTSASGTKGYLGASLSQIAGVSFNGSPSLIMDPASTTFVFANTTDAGVSSLLTDTNFAVDTSIYFSGHYSV